MGGFFLCPPGFVQTNNVLSAFKLKGFEHHSVQKLGDFKLIHYGKQFFPIMNFIKNHTIKLFVTGTLIYKGKNYEDSLKNLASDLYTENFEPEELKGNYFVIYEKNNKIFYLTDPDCFYNIYYNEDNGTLSSSFIASIMSSTKKLSLNKDAILEILTTGYLIGPDTLIKQIKRLEPFMTLPTGYPQNICTKYSITAPSEIFRNRKDAVMYQLDAITGIILELKNFLNNIGTISGLTGGFDSRLLFFILLKNGVNFTPYSTWRKYKTLEYKCAEELSKAANKTLKNIKYIDVLELNENEYFIKVRDNFYFNDGIIRANQIWFEEIKGRYYLKNILGRNKVNMSGVSGEQYRNSEYLIKKQYNISDWIKYELIYFVSGGTIKTEFALEQIIKNISNKITKYLDLGCHTYITFNDIKRFYNTIYSSANRTIRNSIENQAAFFISPFTEYELTRKSYFALPYLGFGHEFQKDMLCTIGPDYNEIMTDYGFNLVQNIPLRYKMVPHAKKYLGLNIYHKLYNKLKNEKVESFHLTLHNNFNFIKKHILIVKELNLPIDYGKIFNNASVLPLLLELGFFLEEMNDYIKYD